MSGILDDILGAAGGGANGGAAGAIGDLIGSQGGVGGLVAALGKGGLGDLAASWVGTGQNLPVSADQIASVLGAGPIGDMAKKLGVDPTQAAGVIAAVLPQVIDHLTPDGQVPQGGAAAGGGLGDMLGGILGKLGR